jgi:hypothetical protein
MPVTILRLLTTGRAAFPDEFPPDERAPAGVEICCLAWHTPSDRDGATKDTRVRRPAWQAGASVTRQTAANVLKGAIVHVLVCTMAPSCTFSTGGAAI